MNFQNGLNKLVEVSHLVCGQGPGALILWME